MRTVGLFKEENDQITEDYQIFRHRIFSESFMYSESAFCRWPWLANPAFAGSNNTIKSSSGVSRARW